MEFINAIPPKTWALIALGVIIPLLFLLLREFWCWYFKINQRQATLERIEQLLIAQAKREQAAQAESEPEKAAEKPSERSPFTQNLTGEELEEGLKGLVLRADDRHY